MNNWLAGPGMVLQREGFKSKVVCLGAHGGKIVEWANPPGSKEDQRNMVIISQVPEMMEIINSLVETMKAEKPSLPKVRKLAESARCILNTIEAEHEKG